MRKKNEKWLLRYLTSIRDISLATIRKIQGKVAPPEKKKTENLQGRSITFQEPEPWPDPVDGAELLEDVTAFVRRFVFLTDHALVAVTLWIVLTWFAVVADFYPILAITSPEKRCGKSTPLRVLCALVFKAFRSASASVSAIFRIIEKERPTILLDELDTFLDKNEELCGLLDEGSDPDGTFMRTVGNDLEPRAFRVGCMKALSCIGNLPGTVEDRAIPITMKRKDKSENTERFKKRAIQADAQELRQKLVRFAKDNLRDLREADPDIPESLDDRQADCWRPLIAIADLAGGEWPKLAREAALELSSEGGREGDSSIRVQLLSDLKMFFGENANAKAFTDEILEYLAKLAEHPWPEFNRGKPMTPRQLARLLKPFGITSKQIREEQDNRKGYSLADFQDAFSRYIPASDPKHGKQTNTDAGSSGFSEAKQKGNVSDAKSEGNPHEYRRVSDVSDEEGSESDSEAISIQDDLPDFGDGEEEKCPF